MPIEIIKRGTPPGEKRYETDCNNCGTKFSFLRSDATQKPDRNEMVLVIGCPVCGRTVGVNP